MNTGRPRLGTRAVLALPHVHEPDVDYATAFHSLLAIHAEIDSHGPTTARIVRRGQARYALGDYLGAAFDAEHAIRRCPADTEAQFLKGQAMLALAGIQRGILRPGIGAARLPGALPPRRELALTARHCFQAALAANPNDPQAAQALEAVDTLLRRMPGPATAPSSGLPPPDGARAHAVAP